MKSTLMISMVLCFSMVASTQAALVTFSGPVDVTSSAVLDVEINNGYTFVEGVTYGSGAKTILTLGGNTVSLAGDSGTGLGSEDMPAATPAATSGYYNAGTQWVWLGEGLIVDGSGQDEVAWRDALYGNLWHNSSSDAARPLTLHLAGLTIGQEYSVQLYSMDTRFTDRDQAYWGSFSEGIFGGGTSGSFSQGSACKVTGIFIADAAYQDIFIQATDAVGNADTTLAVYTLYEVPEPATMLMLGLGGMMLRRRH